MKKLQLGDLFELKTSEGYVYIQFIYKDSEIGELIRVLPNLHKCRPVSFEEMVSNDEEFMVFFPLSAARKRKIIEYVGHYEYGNYAKPKQMRTEYNVRGEFRGWHIVDTETWQRELVNDLSSEQKRLSPWGVWNDTLLAERMNENWKLKDWG